MKIKIGHRTVEVVEWEFDDSDQSGEFDQNDAFDWIIKIKKGLSEDHYRRVLFHEILHAVFYSCGWRSRLGDMEEDLVILLETQFLDCWDDATKGNNARKAVEGKKTKRHSAD